MKVECVNNGGEVYLRVSDLTYSEFYLFLSKLLASSARTAYYQMYRYITDHKAIVYFNTDDENNRKYLESKLNAFLVDNGYK